MGLKFQERLMGHTLVPDTQRTHPDADKLREASLHLISWEGRTQSYLAGERQQEYSTFELDNVMRRRGLLMWTRGES